MHTFTACGRTVTVFPASVPDAPVVFLNTFGDEGQKVFETLAAGGCPPLSLVAVGGLDWDRDMAPWSCPAVFKNAAPFTGGAGEYLRLLVGTILPTAEATLAGVPRWRGIRGLFPGGAVLAVRPVRDGRIFPRGQCVRLALVPRVPGIRFLPRAPAPAGPSLLLRGRQRKQNAQPRAANGAGEHRGALRVLPRQGRLHNVSAEPRRAP